MIRARALLAAVPQQVWAAVVGLALLASVGLALVVGAGLSAWRGAVTPSARPPAVVVRPPSTGVVVVPAHPGPVTHHTVPRGPVTPRHLEPAAPAPVAPAAPQRTPAPAAPAVAAPPTPVTPPVAGGFVARPRLAGITIDATVLLLTVQADQLSEHSRGLALGHLKQTARVAQARTVTPVVRRPAPEARAHPHRHHRKSADGHARRWHTDRGHGHRGHVHRH